MSEIYKMQESITRISAGAGYLYSRLQGKELLKFRQMMDIFLDKLVKDCDPMLNMREAMKLMMLKKEK